MGSPDLTITVRHSRCPGLGLALGLGLGLGLGLWLGLGLSLGLGLGFGLGSGLVMNRCLALASALALSAAKPSSQLRNMTGSLWDTHCLRSSTSQPSAMLTEWHSSKRALS